MSAAAHVPLPCAIDVIAMACTVDESLSQLARAAAYRAIREHSAVADARPQAAELQAFRSTQRKHTAQHVTKGQTASSQLDAMLQKTPDGRPIWDRAFVGAFRARARLNLSLSPVSYPNAAEDLELACAEFIRRRYPSRNMRGRVQQFAVVSSLSPWAELTLHWRCGARNITVLEFNQPLVSDSIAIA